MEAFNQTPAVDLSSEQMWQCDEELRGVRRRLIMVANAYLISDHLRFDKAYKRLNPDAQAAFDALRLTRKRRS